MTDDTQTQEKVMAAYQIAMNGDFDHARMILEEAIYDAPKNVEAWLLLADLAESTDDALQCYQMVLEAAPDNWIAQQRLKLLFNSQKAAPPVLEEPDGMFSGLELEEEMPDLSSFIDDDGEEEKEQEGKPEETLKEFLAANPTWATRIGIGLAIILAVMAVGWVGSVVFMAWRLGYLIVGG